MKLSSREKVMLIALTMVGLIAAFYYLLLSPQLLVLEASKTKAAELKAQVEEMKKHMDPNHPIYTEFKIKQSEVTEKTARLYPAIFQDKLITVLDEKFKAAGVNPDAVNFTKAEKIVEAVQDLQNANKDKNKNSMKAPDLNALRQSFVSIGSENKSVSPEIPKIFRMHELTAGFSVDADYVKLTNLIKAFEKDKYKILLNNVGMEKKDDGTLTGNFSVSFISVPKLFEDDDKDYLSWLLNYNTSKNNPFVAGISPGVITPNPSETPPAQEQTPTPATKPTTPVAQPPAPSVNSDFAITLRPISSDIPTILVGKVNDKSSGVYVYADNPDFENVEIQIISKNGKLYYKYKTTSDNYPTDYNEMAEFTTKNSGVIIEVLSTKRSGAEDKSGMNLTVINKSSKSVTVSIRNDDASRSRVKIASTSGSVTVKR